MSPTVYYNDSEPFVCDWLENLIREKLIPAGVVDRRPIQEVEPKDVQEFTQCHFFAGIGGWAYALQLAGWGDRPVWTGSCPCQPFSAAGKRGSHADERHLWPAWYDLIRQCRPLTIFGEQVSGATGLGWLDAVAMDLEAIDYAIGACVLGAHSVGAPHHRQRLWFVADNKPLRFTRHLQADRQDEERYLPSCRNQEPPALHQCRRGVQSPWPPGPGRVSEIPFATDGFPGHVGGHNAFGNAIVPQVAAAFVKAYMEIALRGGVSLS